MKTQTLKLSLGIIIGYMLMSFSSMAQTITGSTIVIGTGNTAPPNYGGAFGQVNNILASDAYGIGSGNWADSTGIYSVGLGQNNYDKGLGSVSAGFGNITGPSGTYSLALGYGNQVYAPYSEALGAVNTINVSANYSISLGYYCVVNATAPYSFTEGAYCTTSANGAISMGNSSASSGVVSVALGWQATATGTASLATGYSTTAAGNMSSSLGYFTKANSYLDVAIGIGNASNTGTYTLTSWVATDPIFEIGNGTVSGTSVSSASNLLTVYKNGNATLQGSFTTSTVITTALPAAGDIPMFGH